MSRFEWATVTQIGPLRIKFDGDAAALLFAPDSLVDVATLAVNDRVRVEIAGTRILIHGSAGSSFYTRAQADAAFYTKTQLNAGQLDSRYYTESEIDNLFKKSQQGQIPSSIQLGSGSSSVAADGTVTITGASWFALNGVFDGLGGDIYDVIARILTSTGAAVYTRMRSSGTDVAGTNYVYAATYSALAAGPTRGSGTSIAQFGNWVPTSSGSGSESVGRMTLFNPAKALTTWQSLSYIAAAAGDRFQWVEGGNCNSAVHDGFSIIASAGTMGATIKVVKLS